MTHSGETGFWRRWVTHCITAAIFSLIFFFGPKLPELFGLDALEPLFLLRALDRAGSDAVMQGYRPELTKDDPRVVVVDLGSAPTAKRVADTLRSVARAPVRPTAVGLDLVVVPDPPKDGAQTGSDPVGEIASALKDPGWQNLPIAISADHNNPLADAVAGVPGVRLVSVALCRDEDGVVRSIGHCVEDPAARNAFPTLAEAMAGVPARTCGSAEQPIFFAPVSAPQAKVQPGVYLVSHETVASRPAILDRAYVLLGTSSIRVGSDRFLTPMGELPGVLIHAESIWTLVRRAGAHPWIRLECFREPLAAALDIGMAVSAGMIFSFVAAWRDGRALSIGSLREAVGCFAKGIGLLLGMAIVVSGLGLVWTYLAVRLLSAGVVIGAMSAMFGAMLEALVHVGELLVGSLHWAVERLMKRRTVVVYLTLLRVRLPAEPDDRTDHGV